MSAIPPDTPGNTCRSQGDYQGARRLVAAAGAAATGSQVVAIDGEAPKRVVIYVYPSMEALQAWRNDPAYVEVRRAGEKYAKYRTFAVEGAAP